jgi:hypothetical protein
MQVVGDMPHPGMLTDCVALRSYHPPMPHEVKGDYGLSYADALFQRTGNDLILRAAGERSDHAHELLPGDEPQHRHVADGDRRHLGP